MGVRIILIFFIFGISLITLQAQRHKTDLRCSTPAYNQTLRSIFPQRGTAIDFEKWMAKQLKEKQSIKGKPKGLKSNQVKTIPIIFHIVHNGEATGATPNIGAQYINAQLQQLNKDFANLSGSTHGVAADTKIQFCLAQIDPAGNCLSEPGIHRINRNNIGLNPPPYKRSYFESSIKPPTQWNPEKYYNIWTSELIHDNALLGDLFGYSQLPEAASLAGVQTGNGSATTDGTVVQYEKIGSTSLPFPSGAPYNMGRTLTHETGHWLGLIHIWGDGPCGIDDFCQDTPRQSFSSAGCPANVDSCPNEVGEDMYDNYMDYSNDACMNTFTRDQANRINVVMDPDQGSPRRAILANSMMCGCSPIADFEPEGTTIELCQPNQNITFNNTSERVYPGTAYAWSFSGAGVSPTSSSLADPSVTVSFSGTLTASLTVSNVNGSSTTGNRSYSVTTVSSPPSQTGLKLPMDNQQDISLSPLLEWNIVNGVSSYLVEYSSTPSFNNNVSSAYSDSDTLRINSLLENTVYYWRVFSINACNESNPYSGTPSVIRSFKTLTLDCQLYLAADTPVNIPSVGKPTVISVINVPAGSGPIIDINIQPLEITHSYLSDLTISLTSPSGDASLLVTDICGGADDLNLIFDQDGQPYSSIPCPATNGLRYQALTSFDQFIGTDPSGDWTLSISDAFGGDGGALTGWTLEICTEPTVACDGSLSAQATGSAINCRNAQDGVISSSPSGGTGPYTYYWENNSGTPISTSASVGGLSPSSYYVTVTDAMQCTAFGSALISDVPAISINLAKISDVSCHGGTDGAITASISGGTGSLSYQWSSGHSTLSPTGLPAGSYTISVSDGNSCLASASISISQAGSPLSSSIINQQNINCFGETNGSARVSYSGGTSPYSVLWSNNAITNTANNLAAGTHYVTITDNAGCTEVNSTIITQPTMPLANSITTIDQVSCYGGSDGHVEASPSGGTSPYQYLWSSGAQSQSADNLPSGTHYVTITDANSCIIIDEVVMTEPPLLSVSFDVNQATCDLTDDADITALISGGTSPYTILWEDSTGAAIGSTALIDNLFPGKYYITVTDDHNCSYMDNVDVTESFDWIITPYSTSESCAGVSDGELFATATGGSGSYTYSWQDASGNPVVNTSGLSAGTYEITCTDMATGCELTDSVTLITLPAIQFTTAPYAVDESCYQMNDGSLHALASGGNGVLMYTWRDSLNNIVADNNLIPGLYTLEVTDQNGQCPVYGSARIHAAPLEYTMSQGNMLTGTQQTDRDYESSHRIESDQKIIGPNLTVDYDAATSITLEAGFEVKAGNILHAFIDGCGGSQ